MMNSQETDLTQEKSAEEAKIEVASTVNETEEQAQEQSPEQDTDVENVENVEKKDTLDKLYTTKQEVLDRVKELAHGNETPQKKEIDLLKTVFYKLQTAEQDAKQQQYLADGGDPDKYVVLPDELEEEFKAEMILIREMRTKAFQDQETEKQENLKKKLSIIDRIKAMATSPDEVNKSYSEFKELQQQWKEIKAVPMDKANELWRNYQLYVEQFYDLLKLNNEAREYDFKKNQELKEKLCEAAEKLADEEDVISAFYQLQELHQQYKEIGPVSKDLREEIWARFKAASSVVNKRHQQHFEELRSHEDENLKAKEALCERVEEIAKEENKSTSDWERHTKDIIALQAEWKTIGFAPHKMNVKIFERFRAACDDFFGHRAEHFKEIKAKFAENAEKKKALVAQAQELTDSTDWKTTGDKLVALQKEWRTIGIVPKKLGDKLWEDFLSACNHFFAARNEATSGTRNEERDNLNKKRDIISQLKELAGDVAEITKEKVQNLVDEYNKIGHVPYKEKDKLYEKFREVVDELYKTLGISSSNRRLDNFKNSIKNAAKNGERALDNERGKLMHHYEQLKQEVITYENNLGFLNASSKKGNSLLDEMNRKVQRLKDEVALVREKIKAIDLENK